MHRISLLLISSIGLNGCMADGSSPGNASESSQTTVTLRSFATLQTPDLRECSGLVASRSTPGLFWAHNDSGNPPYLFPVTVDGQPWPGSRPEGILIEGARNLDWEDITFDDDGNLVIGDVGNNANDRRDLAVHFLREPNPLAASAPLLRTVRVAYPDQLSFPPSRRNFDAEAIFWADGRLHILTKHRSDSNTVLYRLDREESFPGISQLTRVAEFPIGGMVTAADASRDGLKLAVLTYGSVWLFERDRVGEPFFEGRASKLNIRAWQAEAIAFEPGQPNLIIANEQRGLYRVRLADLAPVKK
jgi:hypothetical protein